MYVFSNVAFYYLFETNLQVQGVNPCATLFECMLVCIN